MQPYGIPTDQFEIYSKSVHGEALLQDKDVRAPTCASCHGSHDAKPPPQRPVVEVCGKCHTATQALYEQSRHSELQAAARSAGPATARMTSSQPGSQMFFHPTTPDYTCSTCHDLTTHTLRLELSRFAAEPDRRCDTCHHPDSDIYAQIQGIASAVTSAQTAYDDATPRIEEAARLGMITSDAAVGLAGAKTSLIQAQAAVHTTKLTLVAELSTDATTKVRGRPGAGDREDRRERLPARGDGCRAGLDPVERAVPGAPQAPLRPRARRALSSLRTRSSERRRPTPARPRRGPGGRRR